MYLKLENILLTFCLEALVINQSKSGSQYMMIISLKTQIGCFFSEEMVYVMRSLFMVLETNCIR